MEEFLRDDAPHAFRLSRRQVLIGGGALLSGTAISASIPAWALQPDATSAQVPTRFMRLSHLLIAHRLDVTVGSRLAAAMHSANPQLPGLVDQLIAIAKKNKAAVVEDFFPDIPEGKLKQLALDIISAWYKGVLVDVAGAEVFAYELALMYQPTIDVMTIPTYAISGPNQWNAEAPPLDEMPEF